MIGNIRYALRQLARSPGYAAVAVGTLALGIGASTAIFSLVEAALLRGLPFSDPSRLVALWESSPRGNPRNQIANANFARWTERARSFTSMAGYAAAPTTIAGADDAIRTRMGMVTPGFFETLGVAPVLGRGLRPADSAPGAPPVAVLSETLWRRRYAADPALVGRSITVDGRPTLVVGVMPGRFDLPQGVALWAPVTIDAAFRETGGRWMSAIARLEPGVTVAQARAEMDVIAATLRTERPGKNTGWGITVTPLHDDLVAEVRPQLLLLMAGVALLLVMACVNVTSLTLSRALTRMREFAIRTALGAGRGRLVRQLVAESLVLCVLGSVAGLLLGQWALHALTASMPAGMPEFMAPRIGLAVIAFTVTACLAAAIITGVLPALRLAGSPLLPSLREGAAAGGVGPARRRLRGLLVAAQMGVALVLVAGGGLLLRSFIRLSGTDAGFDPRSVLTLDISLPDAAYTDPARQARFFQQAVDALATMPGATAAGGVSWLPFTIGSATSFELVGRPAPAPGQEPGGDVRFVTPGLFRALGVPILEGRDISIEDGPSRPTVVVVNQAAARELWPGESALGKRVRMEWGPTFEATVVGVVGDVRMKSIDKPSRTTLYWSQAQIPTSFMSLVVKTSVPPATLTPTAVEIIRGLDRGIAVEARPLADFVAGTLQQQSFTLMLTLAFGITAIALAAVGLFGVVGQAVGERRREFALRLALGAPRDNIRALVIAEGFRWTVLGALLGLPAALVVGRGLGHFLFEISPADPATFAAVLAILSATAFAAVALPAWRAARVDPVTVLRGE
jgi:putative ABC transport system permease protein